MVYMNMRMRCISTSDESIRAEASVMPLNRSAKKDFLYSRISSSVSGRPHL